MVATDGVLSFSVAIPPRSIDAASLRSITASSLVSHCQMTRTRQPSAPQGRFLARVPDDIGLELLRPERNPGLGGGGVPAAFVPMPEAAVHEDGQTVFREHQVRAPGEVLALQAEAQAHPVSDAADRQFGSRVASTNPCHQLASSVLVYDVGHAAFPVLCQNSALLK